MVHLGHPLSLPRILDDRSSCNHAGLCGIGIVFLSAVAAPRRIGRLRCSSVHVVLRLQGVQLASFQISSLMLYASVHLRVRRLDDLKSRQETVQLCVHSQGNLQAPHPYCKMEQELRHWKCTASHPLSLTSCMILNQFSIIVTYVSRLRVTYMSLRHREPPIRGGRWPIRT